MHTCYSWTKYRTVVEPLNEKYFCSGRYLFSLDFYLQGSNLGPSIEYHLTNQIKKPIYGCY